MNLAHKEKRHMRIWDHDRQQPETISKHASGSKNRRLSKHRSDKTLAAKLEVNFIRSNVAGTQVRWSHVSTSQSATITFVR
jgi:hypothetical protein